MKPNRFLQLVVLLFSQALLAQETNIKVTNANGIWTIAGKNKR